MPIIPILDTTITNRVNEEIFEQFKKKAFDMDKKPQELIRELISATVENRIKLIPPKAYEDFYISNLR